MKGQGYQHEIRESAFDIIYLLFAVVIGVGILRRRKDRIGCLMGSAVLILGLGWGTLFT